MIALDDDRFYRAGEVAAWMRKSLDWFYRHREKLQGEGFPTPVSNIGQPRWRGSILNAWSRRQPVQNFVAGGKVIDLAAVARARSKAMRRAKAG